MTGSILWPIPFAFAIYKAGFLIANACRAAAKLGEVSDPIPLYAWIILFLLFTIIEIVAQLIITGSKE